MLTNNRLYPHLSYEVITNIAQIIDTQLKNDWVIRIEYTNEIEYLNTSWQQWGKSFFKIKAPDEVMDNIFACHLNNQSCTIRLHAEKFNPSCNFYFSVCQACQVSKEVQYTSHESANIISIFNNRSEHNEYDI